MTQHRLLASDPQSNLAANRCAAPRSGLLLCCAITLLGCGGASTPAPQSNTGLSAGMLEPVTSEAQFLAAVSAGVEAEAAGQRIATEQLPGTFAPVAMESIGDTGQSGNASFTTTYTLEAAVDEYDLVKYDGEHLFIANSRRNLCCIAIPFLSPPPPTELVEGDNGIALPAANDESLVASSFAPEYQPQPGTVRILATDRDNATAEEVATINLPTPAHVQGMYRFGQRLAVLSTENFYGHYGRGFIDIYAWYRQRIALDLYTVAEPAAVDKPDHHIEIEGGLVESRRIGNTIYVISRHTPAHPLLRPLAAAIPQQEEGAVVTATNDEPQKASDLIPQFSLNGESRDLFYPTDCFVTNEKIDAYDRPGYAVITSITAIPVDNPLAMKTLCYNESAAGIYVAEKAIYLTDVRYADGAQTVIHKFALNDIAPEYRGSAIVPGYVWSGGQLDFRLNEYQGNLRIVTSEFTGVRDDRVEHRLFVLQEAPAEKALAIVGQLPNELRPQPIGKPNEALYGVRFFAERAYMVTFEQIDPLYVLDLADSRDPKIAGELEVPGFSDFLHPVNNNLLLGLGQAGNGDWRVKLELFDVSNMENPLSLGDFVIGDQGSNSSTEARYNRHAFTYQSLSEQHDRFAIPVAISGLNESGSWARSTSLQLFEIANKNEPANAVIKAAGAIQASPEPLTTAWWPGDSRSVFDRDAVFFVSGGFAWSALWSDPETQSGPY
ncbi:MAG: hypothetical protein HKO71_07745 [Pseudomonadales bacterium]|nr:hypothetical protein [Pseudomonadales bacterium]